MVVTFAIAEPVTVVATADDTVTTTIKIIDAVAFAVECTVMVAVGVVIVASAPMVSAVAYNVAVATVPTTVSIG